MGWCRRSKPSTLQALSHGARRSTIKKTPRAKPAGGPPETPALAELTEEEKLQIATQEELDAKLKFVKGFYDKMKRDLSTAKGVEETLKRKPWLDDGVAFLHAAMEKQQQNTEELFGVWTRVKASEYKEIDEKTRATAEIIQAKDTTESLYTKFKKEVLSDFLKLK